MINKKLITLDENVEDFKINKDEIVILSQGEYSSYHPIVVCKANENIDCVLLLQEYSNENPEEKERFRFNTYKFINWLINIKKTFQEITFQEWNVASYSGFKESYLKRDLSEQYKIE